MSVYLSSSLQIFARLFDDDPDKTDKLYKDTKDVIGLTFRKVICLVEVSLSAYSSIVLYRILFIPRLSRLRSWVTCKMP